MKSHFLSLVLLLVTHVAHAQVFPEVRLRPQSVCSNDSFMTIYFYTQNADTVRWYSKHGGEFTVLDDTTVRYGHRDKTMGLEWDSIAAVGENSRYTGGGYAYKFRPWPAIGISANMTGSDLTTDVEFDIDYEFTVAGGQDSYWGYYVDFGDGENDLIQDLKGTITHTYYKPGKHTIKVWSKSDGCYAEWTKDVSVRWPLSIEPVAIQENLKVSHTGSGHLIFNDFDGKDWALNVSTLSGKVIYSGTAKPNHFVNVGNSKVVMLRLNTQSEMKVLKYCIIN